MTEREPPPALAKDAPDLEKVLMAPAVFPSQGINQKKFSHSPTDKSIQTNADVIHLRLLAFICRC
ncbi:hypothetical protein H6F71_17440 [Microcoleus sp. FACHB-61]|nr:hypothetical protein [Microcoleus sp. FACHB-61]